MKKFLIFILLLSNFTSASENLLLLVDEVNLNDSFEKEITKLQDMNVYSEILIDRKTNDTKEILEKMKSLKSPKAISIDNKNDKNVFTKYDLAGETKIVETNKNENIIYALDKFSNTGNPSEKISKEIKPESNSIYYYIIGGSIAVLGAGVAIYVKNKNQTNNVSFSLN